MTELLPLHEIEFRFRERNYVAHVVRSPPEYLGQYDVVLHEVRRGGTRVLAWWMWPDGEPSRQINRLLRGAAEAALQAIKNGR